MPLEGADSSSTISQLPEDPFLVYFRHALRELAPLATEGIQLGPRSAE